jgi:hypothetical protein
MEDVVDAWSVVVDGNRRIDASPTVLTDTLVREPTYLILLLNRCVVPSGGALHGGFLVVVTLNVL